MIALYDKGAIRLKSDFRCGYIPSVGDEIKIDNIIYRVTGKRFDLDLNEVRISLE